MTKAKKSSKTEIEKNKNQKPQAAEDDSAKEAPSTDLSQKNLYQRELERYHVFLQYGFDVAYKYYGFSLFHSLLPEEKVEIMQKLGFEPKNPEDFYNLGCLAAQKEDYVSAREYFEKTIDMAADFEEAYFNLAITKENLGEEEDAIQNWEIYSEFLDEDSSEALLISQRIEDLKAAQTVSKKKDSK